MLGSVKSTSLKNHPQPMLVKSLGIQFVINTRNVESSSVITSVLEIMSLRDKYQQCFLHDINVNWTKTSTISDVAIFQFLISTLLKLRSSNDAVKHQPTKVFFIKSNTTCNWEMDQQGHHSRLRRNSVVQKSFQISLQSQTVHK